MEEERKHFPYVGIDISKKSSLIGRPISFSDQSGVVLEEILPDRSLESEYITRLKMSRNVQAGGDTSGCSVNTERKELVCQGMIHTEGGWPRDVNGDDVEQKSRYRKKVEKEDEFIYKTSKLARETEKYVRQNNTINIFEEYFDEDDAATDIKPSFVGSVAVFKDPVSDDEDRAINKVSWSPSGEHIVMAYCNTEYLAYYDRIIDKTSLVYDVSNPLTPLLRIQPPSPLLTLQYHRRESGLVVGGTLSGHMVLLDTRQGGEPVAVVEETGNHGDPVNEMVWINSKTGTEVIASVEDGRVLRWDTRNTKTPVSCVDINSDLAPDQPRHGATGLGYDPSVPHRYLVSTDLGSVVSCSLKNDNILSTYNSGHHGTLHSIHRNPLYNKLFLTTGDQSWKIWSEDVRSSSILSYSSPVQVTSASWSHARPSVLVSGREDGAVMTWDLMFHHTQPIITTKLSNHPITDIKFSPAGNMSMVSTEAGIKMIIIMLPPISNVVSCLGSATLLQYSDSLLEFSKDEKLVINNLFDRETRRERILCTLEKEEYFSSKTTFQGQQNNDDSADTMRRSLLEAEEHYFETIKNERDHRVAQIQQMFETEEKDI